MRNRRLVMAKDGSLGPRPPARKRYVIEQVSDGVEESMRILTRGLAR